MGPGSAARRMPYLIIFLIFCLIGALVTCTIAM
jgi:hypothetical protein